jgi:predicted AlkP superfamily phosphohydrolase/phosphomutase
MEDKLIPVKGHKNFYRDENSNAIVNCDAQEYSQYIKMKNEKKRQKEEIEEIKNDINEIKSLLKELLDGSR